MTLHYQRKFRKSKFIGITHMQGIFREKHIVRWGEFAKEEEGSLQTLK